MTTTETLITPFFTAHQYSPCEGIKWRLRDAIIKDHKTGETIFEQKGCSFPEDWSDTAVNVVASKYFKGKLGTEDREWSLDQMLNRVVEQITEWGRNQGYFDQETNEAQTFSSELKYILVHQMASFNSPVWFNVGVPNTNGRYCYDLENKVPSKIVRSVEDEEHKPQCSACFILSVGDTMEEILDWYVQEGLIFANGSGAGTNLSTLRGSMEDLSGGGKASGPCSFMKAADANAGTIKSGGKTRRAAKLISLNVSHPDIEQFISLKSKQEKIANDLKSLGYDPGFNVEGGVYGIVAFQNANHSVRVDDDFMEAVESGDEYALKAVKDGKITKVVEAKSLFRQIAEATHQCGDPGMQFDTTINNWNTCKASGRINASNPCGEYNFLDDSACNLASTNLLKFLRSDGSFDIEAFKHVVTIMSIAQDILVDASGYPTPKIALNSHLFRPLGLGYANLGGLLMAEGLAYDSDAGRSLASAITALMTGEAYKTSALLAEKLGAFEKFEENRDSMLEILGNHRIEANLVGPVGAPEQKTPLQKEAGQSWACAFDWASQHGVRNAQVTVLAPTGTIAFMMDCATTGIEPELGLKKTKTLVGGGTIETVNPLVGRTLMALGYPDPEGTRILEYIHQHGSPEGCPDFDPKYLPVFDTSFSAGPSHRSIPYMAHIKMMAAVQPFISGAISKTINMPNSATVEDIEKAYMEAWKLGLKAVAIYRDGCKSSQPLTVEKTEKGPEPPAKIIPISTHRKLDGDRPALIHEFQIERHKGFLTVGFYPDGKPAEIFLDISKEGSTISGLLDAFAIQTSFALQYGVPLQKMVEKFSYMKFDPAGFTGIPELGYAHSIIDYVFRWLGWKFLNQGQETEVKIETPEKMPVKQFDLATDAPPCPNCGGLTQRSGTCHRCTVCGETTGCS
jgi:ribonucleoside-diphosphate reductase alpha chain